MRIETIAVHAGHRPDPATGAVTPPIHLTTTFARDASGELPHGFIYARTDNPTRRELEASLAALEGGETAIAFASGMAATAAVFQSLLPGEHVVAPQDAYYGTARLLGGVMADWGLASTLVDMTDPHAVAEAIRPETRLIWIETPSNPALAVTDIARIAAIARAAGARCECDNTWATPILQSPLALGCDAVMPATVPCTLFCGDTLGAIGVRPNCDPTKKPSTSYAIVQIATPTINPTPSGWASRRPANPPRPPMYANPSTVVETPRSGRPGVTSHKNQSIETMAMSAK